MIYPRDTLALLLIAGFAAFAVGLGIGLLLDYLHEREAASAGLSTRDREAD